MTPLVARRRSSRFGELSARQNRLKSRFNRCLSNGDEPPVSRGCRRSRKIVLQKAQPNLRGLSRSMIASLLSKFENQRVDRERGAGAGVDLRHRAVSLGAQHVPHLHGFDDGERLDLVELS
jgi:hypothetical protein